MVVNYSPVRVGRMDARRRKLRRWRKAHTTPKQRHPGLRVAREGGNDRSQLGESAMDGAVGAVGGVARWGPGSPKLESE